MVMIWGLQGQGAKTGNARQSNLTEMHFRTAILLDMLEAKKEKIIVPTVLVGELLAGIEPQHHGTTAASWRPCSSGSFAPNTTFKRRHVRLNCGNSISPSRRM